MPEYRYELRRGEQVIATGHLSREQPLEVGERIAIGSQAGIVRAIEPLLGERELRLVVQLLREGLDAYRFVRSAPLQDGAGKRDGAARQGTALMFEHKLRELFGGELAQRFDARRACVRFEPADVCVGDAFACEFALAEPEFESSLPDAVTDRRRVRADASAVHS